MIIALATLAWGGGALTLRNRTVVGAIGAHTALNFAVFLPIGAVAVRL